MENQGNDFRPLISEVIIVEGRDDTSAVNRAVRATTIETHGFGLSETMWKQIETAYNTKGIIVFTDPDFAGGKIRRTILSRFPNAKEAFLPREAATKKGDIGIENASPESIVEALMKAKDKIVREGSQGSYYLVTEDDLAALGLVGCSDSKSRREYVGDRLGIGYGNGRTFLKRINGFGISLEELAKSVREIQEDFDEALCSLDNKGD